ncbi:hypothetical protein F2Q68_00037724, partial [Brassica cretica]
MGFESFVDKHHHSPSIRPLYIKPLHLDEDAQEQDTRRFFFETTQTVRIFFFFIALRFIRYISNHCILMKTHKSKTPGVSSLKQLKLPSRLSIKIQTWKKKKKGGQGDGVDSITQAQPSFLSTVLG